MPIAIFPHEDFSSLLEAIGEKIALPPTSPVRRAVVVPSLHFSDHLQRRITDRFGICMGLDFLMPQDFVQRAISKTGQSQWSKRNLVWRILPHVAKLAPHLGVENPSGRDRFALAGLLADRLDQYGHFRPEIIRNWNAGKSGLKRAKSGKENERWQRDLWLKLCKEIGVPHPAIEIENFKGDSRLQEQLAQKFPKLLVLGTGAIDPLLVEVLGLLSEAGGEIEAHVLLPSLGYLGDLKKRRVPLTENQSPEDIDALSAHPLLESMGRHAVGSFLLLGKLDDQYTNWPEPEQAEAAEGPLLGRLQSDIRSLRPPHSITHSPEDLSVRVHSCFGARREMEALRDEILRAFQEIEGLKPEDIHIVTPSLETYAPLVTAVLEHGGQRLPIRLTEQPPSGRDPLAEGVLALLDLARGMRFEASGILELLQLETVQRALGTDEEGIEKVRRWIGESGVTHGLEGEGPGIWSFSRNRLVAGRWFGSDSAAKYPDGRFVLPAAEELSGDLDLREHFQDWFYLLEKTMLHWQRDATAAEWAERLTQASRELLAGEDEARLAIQPVLAFLGSVDCVEAISSGAILDWMESECAETGRRIRASGKIPIARFKQLQNIPCRVLAMVGMQDGKFPGQDRSPAWDLLRAEPRVWDRNARIDDRQLFLDALLTPKDRLIITASTRNVRTQKTEPLSSCVDELLRVAKSMGARDLVVSHRLQPFAPDYFNQTAGVPPSFDSFHADVATKLRSGEPRTVPAFWNGKPVEHKREGGDQIITIPQLVGFWKDPAKAFIKAMGIALPQDEQNDEELNRTPLSLDTLAIWGLKQSIVETMVASPVRLPLLEQTLRADRMLPPGHIGSAAWSANRALAEPLGEAVKKHAGNREQIEFEISPGLRVVGEVLKNSEGDHVFACRTGAFKKSRHFLEIWIPCLLASCSGMPLPTLLIDETTTDSPKELAAIPAEEAHIILSHLVEGYLKGQGVPLCYAPAASDVFAKKILSDAGKEEALEAAENDWSQEDARYGGCEGTGVSQMIAWRGRNPFEDAEGWARWGADIAVPLRKWGGF